MRFPRSKVSKSGFEIKLVGMFDANKLFANLYEEDGQKLTLYYIKGGDVLPDGKVVDKHIGTWSKGEGWIF